MKKLTIQLTALAILLTLSLDSCNNEYLNPSSASETQVTSDINGLLALANGMQYRFTVGRQSPGYAIITANGLTAKELKVLNAGNTDEQNLQDGGASVGAANSVITNLWAQSNIVKGNADLILNNLDKVPDPAVKSGLQAYASIFKALAIGTMAQFWQQTTIQTADKATFASREDGLKEAIRLLETASAAVTTTPPSSYFTSRIVTGIDIPNTLNALIARYALMVNDNDKALAASAKVDLTKKSQFTYDDVTRNPIFDVALSNVNVYQPADLNMGLPAALAPVVADKRIDFYFQSRTISQNTYRGKGFFKANTDPIPVYLPGEIQLIKAEAYARKNDLVNAVKELDGVLTKKTDAWGLGADLPAYAGDKTQAGILTEIYRNRRIELFMSGLGLEDSRRFGRTAAGQTGAERSRNFYPFPQTERDNNSNTPADPAL